MKEFLNKLANAIENNDFETIRQLGIGSSYSALCESLPKEIVKTAYFPSLNPECEEYFNKEKPRSEAEKEAIRIWYSDHKPDLPQDYDYEKLRSTLEQEALERIEKNDDLMVRAGYDSQAIEEISDQNFITLFETALLIGWRIECDPRKILFSCFELFSTSMLCKELDPREPFTFIPYSKLKESPKEVGGEVIFSTLNYGIPDLSWLLTPKEAAEFAILKGYPENEFIDLLIDQSNENNPQKSNLKKQQCNDSDNFYKSGKIKNTETIRNYERKTLYMIIAALCEINNKSPMQDGLCAEIQRKIELLGDKSSIQTISRHLKSVHKLISE